MRSGRAQHHRPRPPASTPGACLVAGAALAPRPEQAEAEARRWMAGAFGPQDGDGFLPAWEAAEVLGCSEERAVMLAAAHVLDSHWTGYGLLIRPATVTVMGKLSDELTP